MRLDHSSAMAEKPELPPSSPKADNSLLNILFTVIIPILILNKLSKPISPLYALLLALAFPLGFGLWDLISKKRVNWFAILGLANVSLTGGFALLQLEGIWFAIKEASFPLLIGIFVFLSRYTPRPFIQTLFLNPQLINLDMIQSKLQESHQKLLFEQHLKSSTSLLALSFIMSAVLNFGLAVYIFVPIDQHLDSVTRAEIINEQIAQMTGWSAVVILVPSIVFLAGILFYLIRGIEKMTGLKQSEIFRS